MPIPNGTYSPHKRILSLSELREFLDGYREETTLATFCSVCSIVIGFRGKWCIRNNGVECVPTNEIRCVCGHVMTPGEQIRNIVSP